MSPAFTRLQADKARMCLHQALDSATEVICAHSQRDAADTSIDLHRWLSEAARELGYRLEPLANEDREAA